MSCAKETRLSIKAWLTALALLAIVPLFAFSTYTVYQLAISRADAMLIEQTQRSEAVANAVNERLGTTLGYLNSLATSDAAIRGDLKALYAHAQRVVALNPEATAITLIDAQGKMAFITLRPLGSDMPAVSHPDAALKVIQTGHPIASGPFIGPSSKLPVVTLGVPVYQNGKAVYCLRMILKIDSLNHLLDDMHLPPDWIASLFDAEGIIIARTRAPEKFVGTPVTDFLKQAVAKGTKGNFESVTKDGVWVKTVIARVPSWDWTIAIGVPQTVLNAPLRDNMARLVLSGIFFLLLGLAGAGVLARTLSRRMAEVVKASNALRDGDNVEIPRSAIRELDEMGYALALVHNRGQQATEALGKATELSDELAMELNQARFDALTGVPSRELFFELVQRQRGPMSTHEGMAQALLFVDLDGFKHVNDQHGHDRGDDVLIQAAVVLRQVIRDTDVVGRFGGDEFVVCITAPLATIKGTVKTIASRIIEQISDIGMGVGCSIGIAFGLPHKTPVADLVKQADMAMYEAKQNGKNRFAVASPSQQV